MIRWQVAEEVFFQGQTASHSQWLWTPSCIWLSLVRAGLLDISQASVFPHCRQTDHIFCRWNSVIYEVTWQANHQPCHKYMYKQHWYFPGTQEDKRAIPQSATTMKHSGILLSAQETAMIVSKQSEDLSGWWCQGSVTKSCPALCNPMARCYYVLT